MPRAFFRTEEREFLLGYIDAWRSLKGVGKEIDEDGNIVSSKDQLIDDMVAALLSKFPERDVVAGEAGPLAWDQADRDRLHSRVRQLMYNVANRSTAKDTPAISSNLCYISSLTLFKQQYSMQIRDRRDALQEGPSHRDSLIAYNKAVKELYEELRSNRPDEFHALETTVQDMKLAQEQEFHEQSEETRQAILEMLPSEIVTSVKVWERRTGARIYVMAVWANKNGGPSSFDTASKNCGSFLASKEANEIRELWLTWMRDSYGAELHGNKDDVPPSVYPDKNGWPMLPRMDILRLPMDKEKLLLRRYFTLTSFAQGGGQPSYLNIERAMQDCPNSVILKRRLPTNFTILRDLRLWSRADINLWVRHLLDGQDGILPPERRFGWRSVPQPKGRPELVVESFQPIPVDRKAIPWTAAELLYGQLMEKPPSNTQQVPNPWGGLPLARSNHIYSPYSIQQYNTLVDIHAEDELMLDLIAQVVTLERLGPIHCATMLGIPDQDYNPLFRHCSEETLAAQQSHWLPTAFFESGREEHADWCLSSVFGWLSAERPHVHGESKTVYGGPLGVRLLIFMFSSVSQNLKWLRDDPDPPIEILDAISGPESSWSSAQTERALLSCMGLLRRDLELSHTRLEETYEERRDLWEATILSRREMIANNLRLNKPDSLEDGPTATSGVPNRYYLQNSMLHLIEAKRVEMLPLSEEEETISDDGTGPAEGSASQLQSDFTSESVGNALEDQAQPAGRSQSLVGDIVCSSDGSDITSSQPYLASTSPTRHFREGAPPARITEGAVPCAVDPGEMPNSCTALGQRADTPEAGSGVESESSAIEGPQTSLKNVATPRKASGKRPVQNQSPGEPLRHGLIEPTVTESHSAEDTGSPVNHRRSRRRPVQRPEVAEAIRGMRKGKRRDKA